MAKPVVDPDTGVINFPNIVFNNTNCFMRNLSKSLSDMQEIGSKNIPFKMMVIGTNSAINLNIKPTTDDPNYSNIELKNTAEDPTYTLSGYERKEDTYVNSTVYLMLQNGWTENRIYDSQNNIMCSLLLGG